MKKLSNKSGETLIETLMALIVATLVILFLATSITAATHVNKKVEEADTSFNYPDENSAQSEEIEIQIKDKDDLTVGTAKARLYTDDSGQYQYYKGE